MNMPGPFCSARLLRVLFADDPGQVSGRLVAEGLLEMRIIV